MIFRTLVKFFALAFMVAGSACQGYAFSYKNEASTLVTQSSVTVNQSDKTDILFVIDNSGSMAPKQQNVRNNTAAFIAELAKSPTEYHLGILTTDLYNEQTDAGRLRLAGATAPPYFWTSPDPNSPQADAQRQALIDSFNATVLSLGTKGNGAEAGLATPLEALSSTNADVVAHNAGFLRQDADLAIIVVTDEDDCSPPTANRALVESWSGDQDCYVNTNDLYKVKDLVNLFAGIKGGDAGRVRAGLITGGMLDGSGNFDARGCNIAADGNATDNCGCWSQSNVEWFCQDLAQPMGAACTALEDSSNQVCANSTCAVNGVCGPQTCEATPARRYVDFINTLSRARTQKGYSGGVSADSICQNDYHSALVTLANSVVLGDCFNLPAAPVSTDDIRVTVSHQQADGTYAPATLIPRYDTQGSAGSCTTCGGDCAQGAWELQNNRSICLTCGIQQQLKDKYTFSVVSSVTGNPNQ